MTSSEQGENKDQEKDSVPLKKVAKIHARMRGIRAYNAFQRSNKMSWSHWIFLGILSMALSTLPPLSLMAPVPLAIAFLIYGWMRGFALSFLGLSVFFVSGFVNLEGLQAWSKYQGPFQEGFFLFLLTVFFTVLPVGMIKKKIHPYKGFWLSSLIASSLILLLCLGAWLALGDKLSLRLEQTLTAVAKEALTQINQSGASEEQKLFLTEFLAHPGDWIKEQIVLLPAFVGVYAMISTWLTLVMVLRNSFFWKLSTSYAYGSKNLLSAVVGEKWIYLLLTGLVFVVSGQWLEAPLSQHVGENILYILLTAYFFQGFGIFMDFLDSYRMRGFLRTLLVISTVLWASPVLCGVGVIDFWVNFRRFIGPQNLDSTN